MATATRLLNGRPAGPHDRNAEVSFRPTPLQSDVRAAGAKFRRFGQRSRRFGNGGPLPASPRCIAAARHQRPRPRCSKTEERPCQAPPAEKTRRPRPQRSMPGPAMPQRRTGSAMPESTAPHIGTQGRTETEPRRQSATRAAIRSAPAPCCGANAKRSRRARCVRPAGPWSGWQGRRQSADVRHRCEGIAIGRPAGSPPRSCPPPPHRRGGGRCA